VQGCDYERETQGRDRGEGGAVGKEGSYLQLGMIFLFISSNILRNLALICMF
jgi:hypothetical protein